MSRRPRPEMLVAYLEREVTASEARAIEAELADSATARRELDELRALRDALASPIPELESLDLAAAVRRALREPAPARSRRARPSWRVALAASAVAGLFLAFGLGVFRSPEPEFRAKSGGVVQEHWAGIQAYRVAPGGEPERLGETLARGDGLLFSYTNLGPRAFGYLMIFALDAGGEVRWFHPAYERAGSNPASLAIKKGEAQVALAELIHHRFPPGPLAIYAVFSMQPLRVEEVEAMLAARRDAAAPLPIAGAAQEIIRARVAP